MCWTVQGAFGVHVAVGAIESVVSPVQPHIQVALSAVARRASILILSGPRQISADVFPLRHCFSYLETNLLTRQGGSSCRPQPCEG